ncbi:Phytosulfokines 3 [Spatholobus suberectus]|nr:Phytosulfokines 3 [Spatholobus suberectus]
MSKITAMFFTILFLCRMITHSARLEPAFHKESSVLALPQDVEAVDENCEGIKNEECLMRRTLTAHIDYIYTQKHNP